jgi:hypothetical protein
MFSSGVRTRLGAVLGVSAIVAGTGAGAATLHRFAVTSAAGSGAATTFLQSTASGSALQGEVASSANTGIKIPFGVLGEYNATGSTFGSGVLGIATTGYGVGAESLSTTQPSLLALNSSGGPAAQVFGESGGDAIDATATGGGVGVFAMSDSYDAISASDMSVFAAIYGENDDTGSTEGGSGLFGYNYAPAGAGTVGETGAKYGSGIEGYHDGSNPGVGVFGDAENASQGFPAIQAVTATDGTELFDAGVMDNNTGGSLSVSTVLSSVSANNSGRVFTAGQASSDLQINGDLYLTGAVYTDCDDSVPYATAACTHETLGTVRSDSGSKYEMYAAQQASKTVEDEGEAELRGGSVHVALDPAFASVISRRVPYLVVTTPEGDTRGVYVTNKTRSGFDVRENGGGRSTVAIDYRIIAHPYGEDAARMALATAKLRTRAGSYPASTRALAAHIAGLAHMRSAQARHRPLRMLKAPASLVSRASFTTR